jgi:hypothetical protein
MMQVNTSFYGVATGSTLVHNPFKNNLTIRGWTHSNRPFYIANISMQGEIALCTRIQGHPAA